MDDDDAYCLYSSNLSFFSSVCLDNFRSMKWNETDKAHLKFWKREFDKSSNENNSTQNEIRMSVIAILVAFEFARKWKYLLLLNSKLKLVEIWIFENCIEFEKNSFLKLLLLLLLFTFQVNLFESKTAIFSEGVPFEFIFERREIAVVRVYFHHKKWFSIIFTLIRLTTKFLR